MDLGFSGEVVDFYHRYRRGYPPPVIDSLVAAFGLTSNDVVLDVGCGTGQLTLPMAARVRAVVGIDPEPDMLVRARSAATEQDVPNVTWALGSDAEMPAIASLLGNGSVGAVTIGQALHWMNHDKLFRVLAPLFRPGGGIAVVANGTPLWQQDSDWSRALRDWLQDWLGTRLVQTCGTDRASKDRYAESLADAGFEVAETNVDDVAELDPERIVGGVFSALPVTHLPIGAEREAVAEQIRTAIEPHRPYVEEVRVGILTGRIT